MHKLLSGYFIFLCLLFLCSCAKKVYTHQQVMQSFHTKDDVKKRFGKPDQVKKDTVMEEWVYNQDVAGNTGKTAKQDTVIATNAIPDTLKTKVVKHSKYIRFIFDRDGNVAGYKSNGIDLSHVTKDSFGLTVLKVLGITALLVIVISVDIYNNTDINL